MIVVAARLHDEVEDAGLEAAEFGGHAGGLDFEFLDGFEGDGGFTVVAAAIGDGAGAVEEDFLRRGGGAVDVGGPGTAGDAGGELIGEVFGVAGAGEAQGQVSESGVGERGADLWGVCLDAVDGGFDFDGLYHGADVEFGVNAKDVSDTQFDVGEDEFLEALSLDCDVVGAGGEVGEVVLADIVGDCFSDAVGGGEAQGDLRTGDGGA